MTVHTGTTAITWAEAKQQLLKNAELKAAYEAIDLSHEVSRLVTDARIHAGITQTELARRIGSKQTVISRLETGRQLPSLSFLRRIAEACGMELQPPTMREATK